MLGCIIYFRAKIINNYNKRIKIICYNKKNITLFRLTSVPMYSCWWLYKYVPRFTYKLC